MLDHILPSLLSALNSAGKATSYQKEEVIV